MEQSLDHTYCRSPDNKDMNDGYLWEPHCCRRPNENISGTKFSNGDAKVKKEKCENGVEKLQSVNLEGLRLASDEANIKNENHDGFDDDDPVDEVEMLLTSCPKPSSFIRVNSNGNLFGDVTAPPIRISKDPNLSAFVPWERIKNGTKNESNVFGNQANITDANERDEFVVFGDYVASEVRNIRGKFHQALAKKKIQDAIFEVQMMLLKDQNQRSENELSLRATSQ